jgi:2-polyprenyl-6-methoxyphenol hydroxylase-like FAD-dependent oxidoreductase
MRRRGFPLTVRNVLIVGGGIGGLATAIALRQVGVAVDLVEIQPRMTVYGVGIIQHGNVVREMSRLGLLDKYLGRAFAFEDVVQYNSQGEFLARVHGHRLAGEKYPANVGISRLELHRVLIESARQLGATLRFGVTVENLTQSLQQVEVACTDGVRQSYDLVVGADGVHSRIRQTLFESAPQPRYTGQSVWRHNFPRAAEIDHLATFAGPHGNAGLCPLADDLMYMYLTSSEPGNPRMPPDALAQMMRDRLAPFGGIVARMREQIQDSTQVVYRPLEVIFVPSPWYRGRVLLVGDAAHTTTPHLGQGAGMAIEDAVVLGELIASGAEVSNVLERFMARRYERCKFVVEGSIQIGDWEMQKVPDVDRFALVKQMMELTASPV